MEPTTIAAIVSAVVAGLCLIAIVMLAFVVIGGMLARAAGDPDRRSWRDLKQAVTEQERRERAEKKFQSAGKSIGYEIDPGE